MAIIYNNLRKKFSTIPNKIITDTNLSHGAVRVFCYLASKPENWEVNNKDTQKQLQIKQSQTLANYWKELEKFGWITRERKTDKKGKFIGGYDYQLNDNPEIVKNHNMEKPYLGKNHTLNNTDLNNNTESIKENKIKDEQIFNKIEDSDLRAANKVAYYLHDKICEFKPNFVCKNIVTWIKPIQLAITQDGRTYQQLIDCIDYIYTDAGAFWRPNILSGTKLREKFDQIEMQFLSNANKNKNANNKNMIDKVYQAERMGAF